MTAVDTIQPGSIVWIGEEGDLARKATWRVLSLNRAAEGITYATVTSGRSGQTRVIPADRLTKFRAIEGMA